MQEKYFNEVSKEWLHIKGLSIKHSTLEKYEFIISKHLDQKFNYYVLSDINEELIMNYFHDLMSNDNYSLSTLKTIRYVLKAILDYAQAKYSVSRINFNFIKLGKINKKYKALTIQQRELLETYCFQHCDNISVVILLSLYGGCRIGEVAGLKWEDIDFNIGIICINRTIERLKSKDKSKTELMVLDPKTTTSKRIVPLPDFIIDYLKLYYQKYKTSDLHHYIYTNSTKIPDPRNIQYHFKRICQHFDININYHSLRHTYATSCVMNNIDIKSLSEMLGHSSVSITLELYVHSTLEFKKDQISKIKKPTYITEHKVLL